MSDVAVVRGRTPDGRWVSVLVPYVEVPGFPSAAPVNEAFRMAHERLDRKLAQVAEIELRTGRFACCDAPIGEVPLYRRHAGNCPAAHVDGTPR